MPAQDFGELSALLTDFATKIKSTEERSNLLKERIFLLDKTFLSENKRINEEIISMKGMLIEIKKDTEQIKDSIRHIIKETGGFARKEELLALERKVRIWEPLKSIKN